MSLFNWFKKTDEGNSSEDTQENALLREDEEPLKDEELLTEEESSDEREMTSYEEETLSDVATEEMTEETAELEDASKKGGLFAKIKAGLTKTRENIMSGLDNVLKSFATIDDDLYDELEEALIMADVGVETSTSIIERLRERVKSDKIHEVDGVKEALCNIITEILEKDEEPFELPSPSVILVIGVNGVGKTTTIGKLTHIYKEKGRNVIVAAADTFRAAAIDQLEAWTNASGVKLIKHEEGSDPGAVVYDAVQAAKSRGADLLICDTAGRLHNKKNLMDELKKISKIIKREFDNAHIETLLVLDATTGQNALQQAKLFSEAADITGMVLTKLDGTAKGGVVIAIKNEMNIPVRFIGVGEGIDDLQQFSSSDYARAIFDID